MLEFTVPGKPVGKQRARVVKDRAYTPKATKAFESSVAMHARAAGARPTTGSVGIQIAAYMPDRRRRDIDNVIKAVMDGLSGVAYEDDAQVVVVNAVKLYDKANPRTEIKISIMEAAWHQKS